MINEWEWTGMDARGISQRVDGRKEDEAAAAAGRSMSAMDDEPQSRS